jgi:hypothetical protein
MCLLVFKYIFLGAVVRASWLEGDRVDRECALLREPGVRSGQEWESSAAGAHQPHR